MLFTFALGTAAGNLGSTRLALGDYLSQPTGDGGLGLGTVVTSALFLAVILALVGYLTVTRKDVTRPQEVVRDAG